MAPSTQIAVAAAALAGCAFVLPQTGTQSAPALRRSAQTQASSGRLQSSLAASTAVGVLAAAVVRARQTKQSSTGLKAFENELGVQAPLGFWDPAGLSSDGDAREFYRRRVVEIKHGRVSMLACTGYIVQEFFRFPGFLSPSSEIKFTDVPNGLAAATKVPAVGWFQYTIFCGICDLWLMHQVPTNPPGKLATRLFGEGATNYEYGFLGLPGYLGGKAIEDPEIKKKKLNAEIANGRLAMMAIIGMFFQDGLTGSAWGDWANYTESPLRAFESELGVQPPIGFWDPLGFTKTDDAASFRRRRYVELKHGRVAMFACLGYIVPEYFRWPGDLSPSLGLKFTDVPTGFAAFEKVPLSGWAQMVFFAGSVELFQYVDDPKRAPGDFALNFSMLQAWFPKEAEIWNQPTWFLSALTFSNLTMPTFVLPQVAQLTKNGLQKLFFALTGISLLQKVSYSETARFHSHHEHPVDGKVMHPLIWNLTRFHPFWALMEMTMGIVAARHVMLDTEEDKKKPQMNPIWLFLAAYASLGLRLTQFDFNDAIVRGVLFVPLFTKFLTAMHRDALTPEPSAITKFFGCKTMATLGSIAFPMFIVHGPLGQIFYKKAIAKKLWGKPMPHAFFPFYLAICLGISHLVNEHFVKNKKVGAIAGKVAQTLAGWTEGMLRDKA